MVTPLSRPPLPPTPPLQRWPLVWWMLTAIVLVTALAWWDGQREADAALADLSSEQLVLAASLAEDLRAHLANVADPQKALLDPGALVDTEHRVARPGELLVLVKVPDDLAFHATDGSALTSRTLLAAYMQGAPTLRLAPAQAAELGLPARTSMAGIAHLDAGKLGHWGVVSIASAARERDREKRARWRLLSSVVLASGLVLLFGGAALRRQRKTLELQRELAVANAQRERDEELQHAERVATMGTFAMGIAHEVSTPLGVIVGRAEQLLSRAQGDERAARNAQAILAQADRIQHIVRRFLDMARGGPPSLERADPAPLVREAARSVEHRFAKAGVRLRVDVPASMPPIQCDHDLLEHAIINLLLNACEACETGGHVELTARSDAAQVAFVVTDDGAGISSEAAARAKEPFFTTKPQGIGTGLGLAIATEIAKSHRGDLTIGPNPSGKGTRALIEIPIASSPGAAA
ncbi:MAG TPA: HAMP domain-containing sensor histidine kinase [Solirubrobacteraceae bacterium]|nr:HAMP domain-containing sensor histidine kinase [Solirubrobacteraceae bacterium]